MFLDFAQLGLLKINHTLIQKRWILGGILITNFQKCKICM